MERGKVIKRVLIYNQGKKSKVLFGRVGMVDILDKKTVEIYIDGNTYELSADAVEILPRSLEI